MKVAYKAIRSRKAFSAKPSVQERMETAISAEVLPKYLDAFREIVANWEHKPSFAGVKDVSANEIRVYVEAFGPNLDIWNYVNLGTGPHRIAARNAPSLAFVWGGPGSYAPKTTPKPSWGGPGKATGKWVFPLVVQHPGNEPRRFDTFIMNENKRWFSSTMENIWKRVIRSL